MNNPKLTVIGLFLMTVLQGCGNSDGGQTGSTEQGSTPGVAGTSSTSAGTKTSVAGTSSVATATGGNTGTGESGATGGSSAVQSKATGGASSATGGSNATGGKSASTGGTSAVEIECGRVYDGCQSDTDCCAGLYCTISSDHTCRPISNGTGGNTGINATGGAKSTGGSSAVQSKATGGASSATGGSNATGGAVATTGGSQATGGSNATGGTSAVEIECGRVYDGCQSDTDCCAGLYCTISSDHTCRPISNGTGGNTGTGGSSATGGATSVASTGGAAATTGGQAATGGASASTGGNATAGQSAACLPSPRPAPAPAASSWSCGTPVRDTSFPETLLNFADRVTSISETDTWVLGKTFDHSYLSQWDGSTWSLPMKFAALYGHSEFNAIVHDSSSVWVGGHAECIGCNMVPRVFQVSRKSDYVLGLEFSNGFPEWGEVVSLWTGEDRIFALVNYNGSAQVYELKNSNGNKRWMLAVSFEGTTGKGIWGTSPNDLFVIGWKTDALGNKIGAFMTHQDGCSWTRLSVPVDVIALYAIHGAGGTVIVVGKTTTNPVRLITSDLSSWTRSDSMSSAAEASVWMSGPNAVLIGGQCSLDTTNGCARLTVGTGDWSSYAIDASAQGATDIARVPSTNSYFVGSTTDTATGAEARLYRVTCQ